MTDETKKLATSPKAEGVAQEKSWLEKAAKWLEEKDHQPKTPAATFTITFSFVAVLGGCGGGGGDNATPRILPEAAEGLYLRTDNPNGEGELRVYTGGDSTIENPDGTETRNFGTLDYGVLQENQDGSDTAIPLGTLEHDTRKPYAVDNADDGAGSGDDIFVTYAYTLAQASTDFAIDSENQLAFIGADSGDYDANPRPTYTISVEATQIVTINLPAGSRYDVDASGNTEDADTREFSFSGGAITHDDVAATEGEDAHRTIDVAEGKIYVADAEAGTGKIISFAANGLALPTTPDIYENYVIVTDKNNNGAGEVEAVADLPTDGTEFYVLGTVEGYIPAITLDGIKFTDKQGGGDGWEIKAILKPTVSDTVAGAAELNAAEVSVDGNTIIIKGVYTELFDNVLAALRDPANGVAALVDMTTVEGYTAGSSLSIARIGNTNFATTKLSGGVDADSGAGTAAVQAEATFAGLTVVATSVHVGAASNRVELQPISSGDDGSGVTVNVIGNNRVISITYDNDATLADLITAINGDTAANALVDFVGVAGTDYDAGDLLLDVLAKTYKLNPEIGAAPTPNVTGKEHTGGSALPWKDEVTLDPEDYTINLRPEDSAAEAAPTAAEAVVPDTDGDPATPEAEATKPSIGRRILDYLFGSQE